MKTTLTSYIIYIKHYDGYKFSNYGEGLVNITKQGDKHYLQLYDTKKDALICENNMNAESVNFSFRKCQNVCQVIVSFDEGIYGLEFDKNSFASFNEFEKNIRKLVNTQIKEVYYKSGNLKYSGQFNEGKLNGQGWEFYDTPSSIFKYNGEFEDNEYDGEGTFTSRDGLVQVHINNISNSVPIDYGKVTIKSVDEYDVDFSQYSHLDLKSDRFCYDLAERLVPNVKERLFKKLDTEDKIDLLWEKMQELSLKLDKMGDKKGLLNAFW